MVIDYTTWQNNYFLRKYWLLSSTTEDTEEQQPCKEYSSEETALFSQLRYYEPKTNYQALDNKKSWTHGGHGEGKTTSKRLYKAM